MRPLRSTLPDYLWGREDAGMGFDRQIPIDTASGMLAGQNYKPTLWP
jgi:hypothetical protein